MAIEYANPVRSRLFPALLALAAALALVLAALFGAQNSFSEMDHMTRARAEARNARLQAEHVLSLVKDIETGARGFALTGKEIYLEPYVAAMAEAPLAYATLKATYPQAAHLDRDWSRLDAAIESRIRLSRLQIEERPVLRQRVLDEQKLFEIGRRSMDELRAELDRRDLEMEQRIDELDVRVAVLRRSAVLSGWLLGAAAVFLVAVATGMLLRERTLRRRSEEALRCGNEALDERVRQRTAELAAARDRIAGFATEQNLLIEAERLRLSREVHDQLGQIFAAQRMILQGLPPDALPADQARVMDEAIGQGVATVRRIAAELRPPLLDDLGLEAAVRHLGEQQFSPPGIAFTVTLTEADALPEATALTLYRILQEAFTNVLRHAGASEVRIAGGPEGGRYRVEMMDDGCGLGTARGGALGIVGMQERAALIGGCVQVQNAEAGGACVLVDVPVHDVKEEHCENSAA